RTAPRRCPASRAASASVGPSPQTRRRPRRTRPSRPAAASPSPASRAAPAPCRPIAPGTSPPGGPEIHRRRADVGAAAGRQTASPSCNARGSWFPERRPRPTVANGESYLRQITFPGPGRSFGGAELIGALGLGLRLGRLLLRRPVALGDHPRVADLPRSLDEPRQRAVQSQRLRLHLAEHALGKIDAELAFAGWRGHAGGLPAGPDPWATFR